MSGKDLRRGSGEEWALMFAPVVVGALSGLVGLAVVSSLGFSISSPPEFATKIGSFVGITTFALLWPRMVKLGFELEEPRF